MYISIEGFRQRMTLKHHKSEGLFHQLRHARFLGENHLDRLVFLFGESRENRFCSLEKKEELKTFNVKSCYV